MSPDNGQSAFAPDHADRCPEGAAPEFAPPRRAGAPAPRPLWITAAGHTCLAWWHAPAARADAGLAPPLAVVLASSWGEEDVAGYDRLLALAAALAEGGLGALRFEWPDTGDSSAATGTTTVADALAAFDAAATHALALSGHARLAFVGLRLGALLAAHAAVAREDVDALVALAPVAGGRAFVREQGARDVRVPAHAPVGTAHAVFDAAELPVSLAGFPMSVRRLEALSHLKWPSAATTSVLEALVLQAPRLPVRTAEDALARMGVKVRELAADGWTIGPAAGGAPAVGVAPIVDWLRERAADATVLRGVPAIENFGVADPGNGQIHAALASARLEAATTAVLALSAAPPPTWMRLRAGAGAVALRERVVLVQEPHKPTLAAVLSERDAGGAAIDRPLRRAVLLLSSGDDGRRIGPQRAWVAWARHRAALGDVSLRVDVGGAGDSAAPPEAPLSADPDERVIDDVRRAVAWLRRELGVRDCTIVGAGPGAARAWRAALAGVDVQHVVAIAPTDLGGSVRERDASDTSAVLRALRRCSHDVARFLRKTHQDALAAAATRAAARGVTLSLAGVSRERALALLRHEMGRAGLALVGDRHVSVHQLVLADPAFASPAGRVELCRRLDALLQASSLRPAPVDAAPRRTAPPRRAGPHMNVDPLILAARVTRPHPARLLVEIPWRQAGLIASCVLAGAVATLALSAQRSSPRAAGVHAIEQAPRPHATPVGDAVRLHMDFDPELELAFTPAQAASAATASTPSAGSVLRMDDERAFDAMVAALETTPPAAGPAAVVAAGAAFAVAGPAWRGPVGGLVLGLLLASLFELRGGRMRTAREAQWALGVPVLGTIPMLSAEARAASFRRAPRAPDGASAAA